MAFAIVEWKVDNSISVIAASCIVSGEVVLGGEVRARYQRTVYDSKILELGRCISLSVCLLHVLVSRCVLVVNVCISACTFCLIMSMLHVGAWEEKITRPYEYAWEEKITRPYEYTMCMGRKKLLGLMCAWEEKFTRPYEY